MGTQNVISIAYKIQRAPEIIVLFSRGRKQTVLDVGEDKLTCHIAQIPRNVTALA